MDQINTLIKWIKESKKTVFFGGAGTSTESGLKDFRSKDGLYNEQFKYPPEIILSHTFFEEHPIEFYEFYREKMNSLAYKPNITHIVLSRLEKKNMLSSIITQNIDDLHQKAGSQHVIELHGSIKRNYCQNCHKFYDAKAIFNQKELPLCTCGNIIKPDVILYEEPLNQKILNQAIQEIKTAQLLIIGGTSLNVYPAAGLIHYFQGKHLVLINKEKTPYDNICNLVIHDNLSKVFKEINKWI